MNLVTPKAGAKRKPLFNKPASGLENISVFSLKACQGQTFQFTTDICKLRP